MHPQMLAELAKDLPIATMDPDLLQLALPILSRWHSRFPADIWGRMTKFGEGNTRRTPKVLKELNEIAPVLRRALSWIQELPPESPAACVVDLCSGFGFLGMFLAEMVPEPSRLATIILVDRGWPNPHVGSKGSISNDHIYGHGDWRVHLQTIKSDIKEQANVKSLVSRLVAAEERPCFICAVHLCGTLSLRAAQLFNGSTRAQALALVPCCMPPKKHASLEAVYELGQHRFSARDVRDPARFPTASCRFGAWVENVSKTLQPGPDGDVQLEEIAVNARPPRQHGAEDVHYKQNLYIFARRGAWGARPRPCVEEEVAAVGGPVVVEARWLQPSNGKEGAGDAVDDQSKNS